MCKFFTFSILIFFAALLNAQDVLNVHEKNNTKTLYNLKEVQKVIFSNGTVIVQKKDASKTSFFQSNLAYFDFTNINNGNQITELLNSAVIYPNPVKNIFRIKSNSIGNYEIVINVQIFGVDGKVVFSKLITDFSEPISIEQLTKGIYICRINNGIYSNTIKLIKE